MNIRPLGNRVVVLRDPKPSFRNGIALPSTGHQQSYLGTVEKVGPGLLVFPKDRSPYRVPGELKPGDRVYLPEMGGQTFEDLDPRGPIVIIEEDFIKAVIE
jgi:co-chaperonin GroES (HSP10)